MSLIECGKEVSDTLNCCSNCGCPIKKNRGKFVLGIMYILLGIGSIIWGLQLDYYGVSSMDETYGGDAYTGIQNAASTTANNVNELGYTLTNGLRGILVVMGGAIVLHGLTVMSKKEGN